MIRSVRFALAAAMALAMADSASAAVRMGRSGVFKGKGGELIRKIDAAATRYVEPVPVVSMMAGSLSFSCGTAFVGGPLEVRLTVTSTGNGRVAGLTPSLEINAGAGFLSYQSGPVPADVLSLPGGDYVTFIWTYTVLSAGVVEFTATVVGHDARSGGWLLVRRSNGVPALDVGHLVSRVSRVSGTGGGVPGTGLIGRTVELRITVTNTGTAGVSDVLAGLWLTSGASLVDSGTGPLPAGPVALASKASQTFTWTFNVLAEGSVGFTATATGLDAGLGILIETVTSGSLPTLPGGRPVPSISVSPSAPVVGGQASVSLGVQNTGGANINVVAPALQINSGGSLLAFVSGPVPVGLATLAPGGTTSFVWTYTVTGAGDVTFTGTVSGIDALAAVPVSALNTVVREMYMPVWLFAGGTGGCSGPWSGPAVNAASWYPYDVDVDGAGNVYYVNTDCMNVVKVDRASLTASLLAGGGGRGFAGDGGSAVGAKMDYPFGLAVDVSGTVYVADTYNSRIRKVEATTGMIVTVAGGGGGVDGGPASSASLNRPQDVTVDGAGNLYIADTENGRVRRVDGATGIITTVCGGGVLGVVDGMSATVASFGSPKGVAVGGGNLYVANGGIVVRVNLASGLIYKFAGGGSGDDGGPAVGANLYDPERVAVDGTGNVFISCVYWSGVSGWGMRIRKVAAGTGIITTAAGTGNQGAPGDGQAAKFANLNYPRGLAVDAAGNLFFCNSYMNGVYRIGPP